MTAAPTRRGSGDGARYTDPIYGQYESALEREFRTPGLARALAAVRTRGERSNADQVSEAGARSVYQFIPSTRRLFMQRHGVDPWAGPEQAARAAALHLLADYRETGSWVEAATRYHGGRDRRNHGPRTRAYRQRVGNLDAR